MNINIIFLIFSSLMICMGIGYVSLTDIALAFVIIGLLAVILNMIANIKILDSELAQFKNTISPGYNHSKQNWNELVEEIEDNTIVLD